MFKACQYLLTAIIFLQRSVRRSCCELDFICEARKRLLTCASGFHLESNYVEKSVDRGGRDGAFGPRGEIVAGVERGGSVGNDRPAQQAGPQSLVDVGSRGAGPLRGPLAARLAESLSQRRRHPARGVRIRTAHAVARPGFGRARA